MKSPQAIEITLKQAQTRLEQGTLLLDIREPAEWQAGYPSGAVRVSRGALEADPAASLTSKGQPALLICASGKRSLAAATVLRQRGYCQVQSIAGGFRGWLQAALPVAGAEGLNHQQLDRYARHLSIAEVGAQGQSRLLDSRVLLIGAGGLGSPAALYLAAAGVGRIGIIDDDKVERSNLQRQILHTDEGLGQAKVDSAAQRLQALNPEVMVQRHRQRLSVDNVEAILDDYQVIVDGSDNLPTRYLLNDACIKLNKPLVYGAVFRFQGQVSVFWPGRETGGGPCYRCLFPEPPPPEAVPSCAEAGVLGVLPGVVGTLQATETIKLLLELGEPLIGRLLIYDALAASFREIKLKPDSGCDYCAADTPFPGYMEYQAFCRGD